MQAPQTPCSQADVGPGQTQFAAQEIDQMLARTGAPGDGLAVHGQGDLDGLIHGRPRRLGEKRIQGPAR